MKSPLRLGLVGCGGISQAHLEAAAKLEGVQFVALSNRGAERLRAVADRFAIDRRYSDWHELIADPHVDAVVNCLPEGLHAPVALEAARHGKHHLVEKPMGLSTDECDAMTAAADGAGTVLMVAQVMRFIGSHVTARRWIAEGRIGRVERVTRRRLMGNALPNLAERPWISDPRLAADWLIYGFGSHEADAVLWLLDAQAEEVRATGNRISLAEWTGWDSVVADITLRGGIPFSLSLGLQVAEGGWDTVVTGTTGELTIGHQELILNGEKTAAPLGDPFRVQMEEFVDSIRSRREPGPSGRSVHPAMALLDAISRSLRDGCAVHLPSG